MSVGASLDENESLSMRNEMSLLGAESSQKYKDLLHSYNQSVSGKSGGSSVKRAANKESKRSSGALAIDGSKQSNESSGDSNSSNRLNRKA